MSIVCCDTCDRRVDTDEEDGGRSDGMIFSCERCCARFDQSMGFTDDKASMSLPQLSRKAAPTAGDVTVPGVPSVADSLISVYIAQAECHARIERAARRSRLAFLVALALTILLVLL